jgi:S-adenosylmethionine hydrolase
MKRPLLTLTSDFGTAEGYAGAMKGRVLSLAPEAVLVDISHEISPQDVLQGAWCLKRAVPQFPPGTLHLAVVDPGVGSARRGIVVETERFLLVGPDNGLLIWAAEADGIRSVRAIDPARGAWRRSATFDGLSLFATVAGHLLSGLAVESVGPALDRWVHLELKRPTACQSCIEGEVILHDRFGNAITNITQEALSERPLARVELGRPGPVRLCASYSDLASEPGVVGALWNSDGHLELFLYAGSALCVAGLARGSLVRAFPGIT